MSNNRSETETGKTFVIPIGGNAYITHRASPDSQEVVTHCGLGNWMNSESICSVFFKFNQSETFFVSLRLKVVPKGTSWIRVSIEQRQIHKTRIEGTESYIQPIGTFFSNEPGYVQLDIQGISKTGTFYGDVAEVILENITGEVSYISHPDFFYFGRRGPSVHFRYNYEKELKSASMEYFYNEVRVPIGQDVIGAFFMATGFSGGYFGMQVNGTDERRILFSVWSDYDTDNPEEIPEDYRVHLLKKGSDVVVKNFGDEGSGKQSILHHMWRAGETYKFLIFGSPMGPDSTKYTAWFSPPSSNWLLIASFQKPKVSTYLKSLHSFLENFIPETGHMDRKVLFGNQWMRDTVGTWKEILNCTFTGDETSRNGREDFAGGVAEGMFFLRNCGFFNDKVDTGLEFQRSPTNCLPPVDILKLP